jgi:hypothetical protein
VDRDDKAQLDVPDPDPDRSHARDARPNTRGGIGVRRPPRRAAITRRAQHHRTSGTHTCVVLRAHARDAYVPKVLDHHGLLYVICMCRICFSIVFIVL